MSPPSGDVIALLAFSWSVLLTLIGYIRSSAETRAANEVRIKALEDHKGSVLDELKEVTQAINKLERTIAYQKGQQAGRTSSHDIGETMPPRA